MPANPPAPDQQRPPRLPAPGGASHGEPCPGSADLVHRRKLEKSVSWSSRERLRCLWYRLRLTVAEMNYATRRTVELQAHWISEDHPCPATPQTGRAITIGGAPAQLLNKQCPPGSGFLVELAVTIHDGTAFVFASQNMIVATPDISTARFGLSPIIAGKTNVAPNIATTCWAPRPTIRSDDSRSPGRTTEPGGGVRPP